MSDILGIKHRATSIKNIGKITKSLETVSALQLKSAEKRLSGSKEYFTALLFLVRKLGAEAELQSNESVFTKAPKGAKKTLFLLVSSDRGLVGGQNLLFLYTVLNFLVENKIDFPDFMIFGFKGSAFGKINGTIIKEWALTHRAAVAHEATAEIVTLFKSGLYSKIYLAYNEFISMQNVSPTIEQFLPLHVSTQSGFSKEVIEPSFEGVLDQVTQLYLSFVLKHAFLEAEASEHSARTLAMKSASDNAQELSQSLTRKYNTARQEAVTEEILEGAFHHG